MLLIGAVVAYLVVPDPWNLIAAAACLGGFFGEVLIWHLSVRGRRQASGVDRLIGQTATTLGECRPRGQVRLHGEIWEARCEQGADRDVRVVITGRDGLTLIVSPAQPA